MGADAAWAEAVVAQANRELSGILDEFGQLGIDRAADWLTAEKLKEVRQRLSAVEPILVAAGEWPAEVRRRLQDYRQRLLELQAVLTEVLAVLRSQVNVLDERRDQVAKLNLWLAAYRGLK